jgi:hypothetical protein
MREHRVLRRALIVYVTAAVKIRIDPSMVPTHLLQRTAILSACLERTITRLAAIPLIGVMLAIASFSPQPLPATV